MNPTTGPFKLRVNAKLTVISDNLILSTKYIFISCIPLSKTFCFSLVGRKRVSQLQLFQNFLLEQVVVFLTSHLLDDHPQYYIVRIGIVPPFASFKGSWFI